MSILNSSGSIYMMADGNKSVEVIKVLFSEYYNPIAGTTPQQIQVSIYNPKLNTTDTFYFLNNRNGIIYNSIQTNETAMPLIELYMSLIPNNDITPQQLILSVLKQYFISKAGYRLIRN